MCTVVVRWAPKAPLRVLALRDELTSRPFDDPGEHWRPGVVGGRDRTAGGTWCASEVSTGATGLVLNRPQKRVADPGAPSRGVLPLAALDHGADWLRSVQLPGMASFALVLVSPAAAHLWVYDGERLDHDELAQGTSMVTSGGAEDGKAERFLTAFDRADWRAVVENQVPADDPAALVVRHEREGRVFATVFGQLIQSVPGRLHVEHSRTPWSGGWTAQDW